MRIAFKEWAAVVDALGHGGQIIVLRKGGIREDRRGFHVDHERFLLFPTLFHQQRDSVIDSARRRFDELAPHFPPEGVVRIEFFAEVVDWRCIENLDAAERLRGQHIWRDEVIRDRFDWGKQKNIHALALRVFRLAVATELPMLPHYGGCKSWVELAGDIDLAGAVPVLSTGELDAKRKAFRAALELAPA